MSKFLSPLRYPGGKTSLFPFISNLLNENNLVGSAYAEPYAGGAGLALKLLFNNLVSEIYLNDYDKAIYSLWYSILHYPDELSKWIIDIQVNIDNWEKCKEIYQYEKEDMLKLGQATLFLNRTNVSGVIKGGAIGGRSQQGKYKIDARFNKNSIINKIQFISLAKNKIHLSNLDGMEFIKTLNQDVFIYFDPPYFKKGSELYMNFFNKKDHEKLCAFIIKEVKQKWIVSYDNEEFIKSLYKNYPQVIYNLFQSTSNKKGKEVIIFSNEIEFKKAQLFLNIED